MYQFKRWIKDNWIWFFLFTVLAGWAWILWLMNGNLSEWSNKPLSQATLGDFAGIMFVSAMFSGWFRK